LAKPYFRWLIDEYRRSRQVPTPHVLDVGCSYGINGALLYCDATINELYERYCGPDALTQTRDTLVRRDRELVRSRARATNLRLIGLDVSSDALAYALSAGFVENAVHADLEERDPTDREGEQILGTDLVISTGCIGYVTDRTIARLVDASGERRPWMAHFVLRMFPFEPVTQCLAAFGYETMRVGRQFKQRRFASREEQALVLDTLSEVGVDPHGLETDGWLYAQLHISRPRGGRGRTVVDLAATHEPTRAPTSRTGG
jgi:carnitine O-acetyltransferase